MVRGADLHVRKNRRRALWTKGTCTRILRSKMRVMVSAQCNPGRAFYVPWYRCECSLIVLSLCVLPGGAKKRKAASKTALPWTPDADDALLNAIVKHGLGNWTRMVNDPEFAARLEGHKANQLRTRWKKLGSAEFGTGAGGSHEHPQQKMEVKKEKPFEQITAPVPMQQQQAPEQQQQHPSQSPQQPRAPVVVNPLHLIPPVPPFVSYRHYPTHVFDEPKSSEEAKRTVKAALGGTVADAQLSTPMDLLPQKPKKRGRKAKNAQSSDEDFSSEDSSGSEGGGPRHSKAAAAAAAAAAAEATVLGGVKNEFRDLEANLDNLAYMNYVRNSHCKTCATPEACLRCEDRECERRSRSFVFPLSSSLSLSVRSS